MKHFTITYYHNHLSRFSIEINELSDKVPLVVTCLLCLMIGMRRGVIHKTKYLLSNYLRVNAQVFLSIRFGIHKT